MTDILSGSSTDRITQLTLPARTVVGVRDRVAVADLADFFGPAIAAVTIELDRLGVTPAGPPVAVYRHGCGRELDVTVGFPVRVRPGDPGILDVVDLPAGPAVRDEHVGPYETLPAAYATVGAWFAARELSVPDLTWEEYLAGPDGGDESACRTLISCPLS